ncbi:hypothetical protein KIL84_012296 [Mauremys mutica]|uniref:Uncharacterized protein n=1 Tax=Mauremys mutica TaxID=74926 RepID=A0A9D3XDM4_9SAUR|nr:hypothetical protein KIL84_012296 [Mauremys mutica]
MGTQGEEEGFVNRQSKSNAGELSCGAMQRPGRPAVRLYSRDFATLMDVDCGILPPPIREEDYNCCRLCKLQLALQRLKGSLKDCGAIPCFPDYKELACPGLETVWPPFPRDQEG